jgi:hypothetical protein
MSVTPSKTQEREGSMVVVEYRLRPRVGTQPGVLNEWRTFRRYPTDREAQRAVSQNTVSSGERYEYRIKPAPADSSTAAAPASDSAISLDVAV